MPVSSRAVTSRTFVFGDIHGDLDALRKVVGRLPKLLPEDTLVFLGDYLDRGPHPMEVVRVVRAFDRELGCKVVPLRGNHEDAWLRVVERSWPEFVIPAQNGCLSTLRSFTGKPPPREDEGPSRAEYKLLFDGSFLPADIIAWMRELAWWYEDEHGIYVHAGLIERDGRFLHPTETDPPTALLWTRTSRFFREYRGKRVVVGHTRTLQLPPELSTYTPDDPTDMWAGPCVVAIDTGAGMGGFLTAVELPSLTVYDSR